MTIHSPSETPVAPAVPRPEGHQPPPAFDERALLAHYVLRDFEIAVNKVDEELRAADKLEQNKDGAEDDAVAKSRGELARQMVIGAWLNRNNPEWDPTRPETHRPDPNDPLVAIFKELQPPPAVDEDR
jgi:hypothetical protein